MKHYYKSKMTKSRSADKERERTRARGQKNHVHNRVVTAVQVVILKLVFF